MRPTSAPPRCSAGRGSLAQAHSLDEWVELDDLVAATRIYLELILEEPTCLKAPCPPPSPRRPKRH